VSHDNGTFDYVYQYKDHLGNVRLSYADSNNDGSITASTEIIEESNYYPYGLKHKGYNDVISSNGNSTAQKFKYNGIELEESLGLNLYEMDVRMYDPSIARFNGIDPVTHHSQGTSVAFDNNPVYWADPSGANSSQGAESWFSELQEGKNRVFDSSPIYDIEGNFLGTDDQGLQGEAIVMSKDDFKQGMSHQEAVSKNVGEEGMTSIYAILDKDSHFQSLKSRPDYDGIVTFSEAAKWMKNGGGDLFIDASKLDLSPIDTDYFEKGVGQSKSYDFFNGYKGLIENTNMALTFGEIWMTLEDKDGTVSLGPPSRNDGFLDSFDFKEKPKSTSKKGRDERNIGARIGREILGLKGSVDFYSYGKAKVKKK
jgi:RHS repeat-associated protein